ncbi:hypothetical protein HKD37_17G046937 [Glycine soja]
MNKGKEEITHLSIIRIGLEQSTKWSDLPAIMSDHNMRLSATERLEEAVSRLTQNQATLTQSHFAMNEKLESILDRLAAMTIVPPSPAQPPPTPHHHPQLKLEVSRFDEQYPLGWIFKISQFLDYQGVPEPERLTVVSFYMEGPALCWYQWMTCNGFLSTWSAMLQALESRFAPSYYDDPHDAFFKLQQRSPINDYLMEFEHLANRVVGLAPPFLLSCFISGLNPDLRREVQALQPMSLPQAMALAKLQEDKLNDRCKSSWTMSSTFTPSSSQPSSHPPPRTSIWRLSSEELASRRDKDLCYHFEDKWSQGHRCKPHLQLFIVEDDKDFFDDSPSSETPLSPTSTSTTSPTPQLSLHALAGM